jgi:metal-responsive CopG/Arc/MetJ family transcriptional regulator
VAKVMVSLPDDLLQAVDIEAGRRGTTRSGFLRQLAEETLRRRCISRVERMAEIGSLNVNRVGHGGEVAERVKTIRPVP